MVAVARRSPARPFCTRRRVPFLRHETRRTIVARKARAKARCTAETQSYLARRSNNLDREPDSRVDRSTRGEQCRSLEIASDRRAPDRRGTSRQHD